MKKKAKNSEKKLKKRLSKGEKSNSKRMATVASVYTINPWQRSAQDIIDKKESESQKPPKPIGKRVWASMDITGARWSLKGAEAVLRLRSLCVSGDWAKYWQFHLKKECERNHQDLYKGGIPLLQRVSSARCSTLNPPKLMMA